MTVYPRLRPRRRTARAGVIVANGLIVFSAVYFAAHLLWWWVR